jgi:hypothetical protein
MGQGQRAKSLNLKDLQVVMVEEGEDDLIAQEDS